MGLSSFSQRRLKVRGKFGAGQQEAIQTTRIPAPVAGVNLFDSLAAMSPIDAIYSYNMVPSEYGFRTRRGYQEWVTGIDSSNDIRTLIPFHGEAAADDALFAITQTGIYDATSSADNPTIAFTFAGATGDAGYGVHYSYTNDGGDKFLFFADGLNGLHQYDPSTTTWILVTDITGLSEANIRFITSHKNRTWLALADSSDAYYLGIGAKGGAATIFAIGNRFPNGGNLVGIYSWSVDGGDGVDDLLVFVSSSGDVAVYQGTDPAAAATWQALGTWNIGQLPSGARRIAGEIGGELHILSAYGLISMSDLVKGVDISSATGQNSIARRITRAIRNDMVTELADQRWDLVNVFSEGSILVVRPFDSGATPIQYVFNFTRAGWGYWRDPPINCAAEFNGKLYFGDLTGAVHVMQNSKDGVVRAGTGGSPVPFSLLTAYSDMNLPGRNKRVHFTRPSFLAENGEPPSFATKVYYDYVINEETLTLAPVSSEADVWDTGLWDEAVWGGDSSVSTAFKGANGDGQMVAIGIQGEAIDRSTLLDINLAYDFGGIVP